jgi:hypothetical protein
MALTYYYNEFLQQKLNGSYVTVTSANVNINLNEIDNSSSNVSKTSLLYVIKAYELDSTTGRSRQLSGDEVKVTVGSTWVGYFSKVGTVNNQYFTAATNPGAGWSILVASKQNVVKPSFVVKLKSDDSTIPYQAITQANWDALGVGMQANGTILSTPPTSPQTFTVTKAQTVPAIPQGLITLLNPTGGSDLSYIQWDPVNKYYVGIQQTYVAKTKITTYTATYWNPGSSGTQLKNLTRIVGTNASGKLAAQNILIDALNGAKNTSTKVPQLGAGTAPKVQSVAAPTEDKARFNPVSHISTRGYSRGLKLEVLQRTQLPYSANSDLPGSISQQFQRANVDPSAYVGRLGKIIQDPNTATLVNTKDPKSLWGFRYTYNPTTVQYSVQGNTSVDWTLGSNDPAALLAGNMQVTFQLYLNRIADMTQLKTNKSKGYVPALSDTEVQGLLNRGTEYDLEFLYRVCNGDPDETLGKNPMLSYNGSSADIGILKQVPVWLHINDNMKLFGSITNINVNHAMFTLDMIPILTTIDITFTRYPAIFNVADSSKGAGAGFAAASGGYLVANFAKFVGGTSTTAGGGTTGGNP